MLGMNLWKHPKYGTYYIWYSRQELPPNGRRIPLKTKDEATAKAIYKAHQEDWLNERIIDLKGRGKFVKISKYRDQYVDSRGDKDDDTTRADRLALNTLIDIIGDKPLAVVSLKDFNKFKKVLQARELSPVSINTYLRHIRAAFNTAVEWGYLTKFFKVKGVKVPKRKPKYFTKEQIKTIKKHAREHDYEMWRIIVFALWTGSRREEILDARYQYIRNGELRIIGKGDKERHIPLSDSPELKEAIRGGDIGPIFKQWHKDTVSKRFKKICKDTGMPDELHFHNLRHSSATYMLSSEVPLEEVQAILGHSDIRTTQIYADVLRESLKKSIKKLSFD